MLISGLKALTKVILETDVGVLYQLTVTEPEHGLVEISCGDPACRIGPPGRCKVLGSTDGVVTDPAIRQGQRLVCCFADVVVLIGPLVSCYVEGAGWHYELWGQQ